MHQRFKQWIWLALFSPAVVTAQPLSNSNPNQPGETSEAAAAAATPTTATAATTIAATPIDPAKQAAIKSLLSAIDADKLSAAISNSAQMQAKQLVPAILSNALAENKKFTEAQKRSLVPQLQQNAVPKLVASAGKVFETGQFRRDAVSAQYKAYADHYTTQEIQALTKFYLSPAGRKFIQVQDQVGRDVVSGLLQKYMPQSIKATREQADKEVASAKLSSSSSNAAATKKPSK